MSLRRCVEETVAGGTWLFLGGATTAFLGFVFWVAMAKLVGVGSVGIASAIVSSAMMATTLVSAGLNIAVIREVAANGMAAVPSVLALALLMGLGSGLVSLALCRGLSYGYYVAGALLAFFSVVATALGSSLTGLERFRESSIASMSGAVAKLVVGTSLAIAGLGALAPILGFMSFPIASCIVAATLLGVWRVGVKPSIERVKSLATLSLSNYPFVFSGQLTMVLSIYLYAYVSRQAASTGTLYIAMMFMAALSMVPGSLIGAALAVGTRRSEDPFIDSLRIGLSLVTPIAAVVAAAPQPVLAAIGREMVSGTDAIRVLMMCIAPAALLGTAIARMNREKMVRGIAAIGLARLGTLMALLPPLTRVAGIAGAALAFLACNCVAVPIAARVLRGCMRYVAPLWGAQVVSALAPMAGLSAPYAVALALASSLAAARLSRAMTLSELRALARVALSAVAGRGREPKPVGYGE